MKKKNDYYFVCSEEQRLGPYTYLQIKSMWDVGQLHGDMLVANETEQDVQVPLRSWAEFLQKTEGVSIAAVITQMVTSIGFLFGIAAMLNGFYQYIAAQNTLQQVTSVIIIGFGSILTFCIPILSKAANRN